jgi:hypothetical protein
MKQRPCSFGRRLLLCLSYLSIAVFCGGTAAPAQDWQAQAPPDPMAGVTRKIDDYGKVGYCDETARLDNFAISLQNEPASKGYLLVYFGKDDLPAWSQGIQARAADYLVNTRGIEPARLKVVSAGYREERTTELWLVVDGDLAPEPTNTVEVKLDKTKAYQWDERGIEVEYNYDPEAEDSQGGEAQEAGDSEGKAATNLPVATKGEAATGDSVTAGTLMATTEQAVSPAPAAGEQGAGETADEIAWKKEVEKYEIAIESRGKIENEVAADDSDADAGEAASQVENQDESAAEKADDAPQEGTIKVSLWWNVESFVNVLKNEAGSRACLIYYHDAKDAGEDKVQEIVSRAVAKMEEQFGLKSGQIVTVNGGYSRDPSIELWVVPPRASLPHPKEHKRRVTGFYTSPVEE